MRRVLAWLLLGAGLLMIAAVVVFHFGMRLSWIDALYFVITTVTTVGYGDISLRDAPPGVKLFGTFLMFAGGAFMAALFGIITDMLLRLRLQEYLGNGRRRMQDHIVLCGLGNVGFRVLQFLRHLGENVVVVEKHEDNRFIEDARALKASVIFGDIHLPSVLDRAGVAQARCLIAATNDDLANLDAALSAREANPAIRVVLRMFDQNLAKKIKAGFGIETAFSASALAAPAFAMAAIDDSVIGSFFVGPDLMLNVELTVREGSELEGLATDALSRLGSVFVLAYTDGATGERHLHPDRPHPLRAGDKVVVSTVPEFLRRLHAMNGR